MLTAIRNYMKIRTIFAAFFARAACVTGLLILLSSPGSALAVTLYKWVDEQGNISYQDTPPPAGQKYEERSFSDEGARTGERNADIARSQAASEYPVTLYRADGCDSCDLAETILNSNKIPFTIVEVDTDTDAQKELQELVGSVRVPTLTIGEYLINGANRAAIEDALRANGYPAPESQTGIQ